MSRRASEELAALIKKEIEKGVPEERLSKILSRKGYNDAEIKKVFRMAGKKDGMTARYVAILVILVVGVLAASLLEPQVFQQPEPPRPPTVSSPQTITCTSNSDCASIFCNQAVGGDTSICNTDTGQCFCGTATSEESALFESAGDPDSLSYSIPSPGRQGFVISERQTLRAKCTTDGSIVCLEPIVDSFLSENAASGISQHEQRIYMVLQNGEPSKVNIVGIQTGSGNALCGFSGAANFLIDEMEDTGRISLLCLNPPDPSNAEIVVTITYVTNNEQKRSVIDVMTL